jgi:hypothetical protein
MSFYEFIYWLLYLQYFVFTGFFIYNTFKKIRQFLYYFDRNCLFSLVQELYVPESFVVCLGELFSLQQIQSILSLLNINFFVNQFKRTVNIIIHSNYRLLQTFLYYKLNFDNLNAFTYLFC